MLRSVAHCLVGRTYLRGMPSQVFVASVSGLRPSEVASLLAELRRAAIVPDLPKERGAVTVRSRHNAIFSADDVLEVIGEWLGQDAARSQLATVTLEASWQPDPLRLMASLRRSNAVRDANVTFSLHG